MSRMTRRRPSKTTPRVKGGRVQRKSHRDVDWKPSGPLEIRVDVPGPGYRHVIDEGHVERFLRLIPHWGQARRGLDLVILADGRETIDGRCDDGVIALTAWPDPCAFAVTAAHYEEHRQVWDRLGVRTRPELEFIGRLIDDGDPNAVPPGAERMVERYFDLYDYEIRRGEGDLDWVVFEKAQCKAEPIIAEVSRIDDELHMYERRIFLSFDPRTAAAYQLLHVFLHELGHHLDFMATPYPGFMVRGENYAEQWAIRTAEHIWDAYMIEFR